jgi:hypothetical protein
VFDVKEHGSRINAWKFAINLLDGLKCGFYLTENTLRSTTKTNRCVLLREIIALSSHNLCEMQSLLSVTTAVTLSYGTYCDLKI